MLVNNPIGIPNYINAPWIIKVWLCDYLDKFNSLHLVQPPADYIRNPVCVRRDEVDAAIKIQQFLSLWSLMPNL
jgi:hypothetical protein